MLDYFYKILSLELNQTCSWSLFFFVHKFKSCMVYHILFNKNYHMLSKSTINNHEKSCSEKWVRIYTSTYGVYSNREVIEFNDPPPLLIRPIMDHHNIMSEVNQSRLKIKLDKILKTQGIPSAAASAFIWFFIDGFPWSRIIALLERHSRKLFSIKTVEMTTQIQ